MIYELNPCALPVDETKFLAIDDSTVAETESITLADALAPADTRRGNADDDIISGCGTDTGTGIYTPDDTTNSLRPVDFVTAGLSANLFNADKLLDAKLSQIQNSGSKFWAVTLTSSQILNLLATPVLVLPSPGVGYINFIKRIFIKLNYNTTPYTLPDLNGNLVVYYGSSSVNDAFENLTAQGGGILQLTQTTLMFTVTYFSLQEMYANDAFYVGSTYISEMANGDSTLSLLIEYETIQDFSALITPPVQPTCLQTVTGTFDNADLTALGNLEITHNLNSTDIMSLVVTDENGVEVATLFSLGNETGANTLNIITLPIGLGISGTWSYALIVNVC